MSEDAVLFRLNVIIALLLAIVAILLWPIVSSVFFSLLAMVFLALILSVGGVMGWLFLQSVTE